jgi:truncated hemoglobin YjbI
VPKSRRLESLFEPLGGIETCRWLSERFHERMAIDPVLMRIFPKSMEPLTERFALFLGEQLGGPAEYTRKLGKQSLVCRHAHLSISSVEADLWLKNMFESMNDLGIDPTLQEPLREYFSETAATLTDPYLPLYGLALDDLLGALKARPALVQEWNGRSLLRDAVCRRDIARVRLLLEFGASANAAARLEHGPLYHAANTFGSPSGGDDVEVVHLLIEHGADVNWASGPGRCTPLHMAARRGNVGLARVLLEAGADPECQDSKGETPLRRAVNCGQQAMAEFLVSRGADPASKDKKGVTPIDAARTDRARSALLRADLKAH